MKKALVVLIGVLMAVMFAAESYAAIEVGGTIDARGRWRENNNDLNKNQYGSTAFWQEKVNLWVDAKIAEGLRGYIELQSGGATSSKGWMNWGTSRSGTCGGSADITTTACTTTASTDSAPNSLLNENRGLGFMEIRYAYIDFMIPSTPVGIKIGHFPVVLGHSIWANTGIWGSDGLLIYAVPVKELMIALGTLKGFETNSNTTRSDADLYVLMANYTFIPKNTLGLNASYVLRAGARGHGGAVANEYWSDLSAGGAINDGANSAAFDNVNNLRLWNIMLTADGAFDFGLGYKFEIDKQLGRLDQQGYEELYTNGTHSSNFKANGLALLLGVDYKIADIAKVGFDVAYGSGDKCGEYEAPAAGSQTGNRCKNSGNYFEGYINFNDYGYTMIYEDIVGQKRAKGVRVGDTYTSGLTSTDFGLYNTMYAKVGASVTPLKDMNIDLNIYYLKAVQSYYYGQSKNLGGEIDLTFGYNIFKNLKWTFMAGYFLAGQHYEELAYDVNGTNTTDRVGDSNAWAFEQKLSLKF